MADHIFRRFGVDEDESAEPPEVLGRSLLTPVTAAYGPSSAAPDYVDDLQNKVLNGFTAEEVFVAPMDETTSLDLM